MPAAENIAIQRRIEALENVVTQQDLIWVRTTIVLVGRGPEPRYTNVREIIAAAERPPRPVVIERRPDLELLIDPVTQTRKLRHRLKPADQLRFDEMKSLSTTRLVDVEITCHAGQLAAILSPDPIVALWGANRAGKSIVLIWWLFRRWMLRGGKDHVFWWVSPTMRKAIEQGAEKLFGTNARGGGMWPDALWSCKNPITKNTTAPTVHMIDGSIIAFQHAHADGDNLKSANVTDAVIDEFAAILDPRNYFQVLARVSQQGGHVALSSTKKRDHWSTEEFESQAKDGWISIHTLELFTNPWMTFAAIWQLFVSTKALGIGELEDKVLTRETPEEQIEACRALVTDPDALRDHFGIETEAGQLLWAEWTGQEIVTDLRDGLWITDKDNRPKRLIDITALWIAKHWPSAAPWDQWAGMDFNYFGHSVILKLYGDGPSPEAAYANRDSWHAVVTNEIDVATSTLGHAEKIKRTVGAVPIFCDPTGAKANSGHEARGTHGSSDVAILEKAGYQIKPATAKGDLPFHSSANVMHVLMRDKRLRIHKSCTGTLDALKNDKASPDRKRKKTYGQNSQSDKRSGYTDAIRYGLWPAFNWLVTTPVKSEVWQAS